MLKIKTNSEQPLTPDEFEHLYQIIIEAYAQTEKEVWGENYVRVAKSAVLDYVNADEMLVAFLDGEIVGGIRCFELEDGAYSFSLLGADFKQAGKGIGRALIAAVEERAKAAGATEIRIEVLRAENIQVASKDILSDWYQRLGYPFVKTIDVFEVYNDKAKWAKLVNPSVFDCYLKQF